MIEMSEGYFWAGSLVVWAIFLVAFFAYALLIDLCFIRSVSSEWQRQCTFWMPTLKTVLSALPLLGLLGTITGLLNTFFRMSIQKSFNVQEIITGGIAEAMFTTQLGLVLVLPGLLMLRYLNFRNAKWEVSNK